MGGITLAIRNWWERADRTQKLISIGGASLFVLLLLGTFLFASRPHYIVLYSGLTDADKGKVMEQINALGISANYDVPGQIEVPSDKAQDIKMRLAMSNTLPKNQHPGISNLDTLSPMTTPAQEQMRLQSIKEGDLDSTIERFDGVQTADVHLNLGVQSSLMDDAKPASASVTIVETGEGAITPKQAKAIAAVVVDGVPGLDPKNVSIQNQSMEILYDGQEQQDDESGAPARFEYEQKYNKERAKELQGMLDEAFGPGTTRVVVHSVLDLDSQQDQITKQQPSDEPVTTVKNVEKMQGGSQLPIGKAGSASNVAPTITDPNASTKDSDYANSQTQETRLVSTINTTKTKVPGTPKSVVFNVIGDSSKLTDPAAESKLRSIVSTEVAGLGGDPQAFVTNVTMVPFDKTMASQAAQVATTAASQSRMQQIIALLPIAALVFIAFMVMRQLGRFAKDQNVVLELAEGHVLSLPGEHVGIPAGEVGAAGLLAAIEGMPGSGDHGMDPSMFGDDDSVNVDAIKSKVHVPLEQIKKMAAEKPVVVGMLIKSLLLEDKR